MRTFFLFVVFALILITVGCQYPPDGMVVFEKTEHGWKAKEYIGNFKSITAEGLRAYEQYLDKYLGK